MGGKLKRIEIRVTENDKKIIQKRAEELAFKSVTAFLVSSAEDFFVIDLDLSFYREVAKEINYIGNNINNLVHHVFAIGAYSDYDLKEIQRLQKEVISIMKREYDYLLKLRNKYKESNMSIKDKERLIKELKKKVLRLQKNKESSVEERRNIMLVQQEEIKLFMIV